MFVLYLTYWNNQSICHLTGGAKRQNLEHTMKMYFSCHFFFILHVSMFTKHCVSSSVAPNRKVLKPGWGWWRSKVPKFRQRNEKLRMILELLSYLTDSLACLAPADTWHKWTALSWQLRKWRYRGYCNETSDLSGIAMKLPSALHLTVHLRWGGGGRSKE